jgi:hypothetical protein
VAPLSRTASFDAVRITTFALSVESPTSIPLLTKMRAFRRERFAAAYSKQFYPRAASLSVSARGMFHERRDGAMAEHDMLLEPYVDASAWTGVDMQNDDSWIYHLSDEEITEIESALQHVKAKGLKHSEITEADFPMPHFGPTVAAMREQVENGRGLCVLKGVPVQGKSVDDVELVYAGLAAHVGKSIVQDPQGTLIDHVMDRGLDYGDISVRGYTTNAELTPHCDSGDIVSLLCVRQAMSGGINTLASSTAIYNELLAKHREYIEALTCVAAARRGSTRTSPRIACRCIPGIRASSPAVSIRKPCSRQSSCRACRR